ncbi:MAG: hypothetical protein WCQ49_01840 [Candidatus Saccharibacteria bacterium]
MSTFVDIAINPKTNKPQRALSIDDYYGSHQYGVGFRNDGSDADLFYTDDISSEYTVYLLEEIEQKFSNSTKNQSNERANFDH